MKKTLPLLLLLLALCSCHTVPYTGESRISLISSDSITSMSVQQYDQVIKEANLSKNRAKVAQVLRVGKRLAAAVDAELAERGIENTFSWEFNVIEDKQFNAFCMPGGKIVVYTGIMSLTQSDDGLAVVLGHEIAHALAEHGHARVNKALMVQGSLALLGFAVSDSEFGGAIMGGAGALASVGIVLPHSRDNEYESDALGLQIMARAGYDPREAVGFWQRMGAASEGAAPAEFMSTHPSHDNRIARIQSLLPEAMKYYRPRKK